MLAKRTDYRRFRETVEAARESPRSVTAHEYEDGEQAANLGKTLSGHASTKAPDIASVGDCSGIAGDLSKCGI